MKEYIKIWLCVICVMLGRTVSYAQWAQKKADMTLYSCEIVNEPLKKYISEQFIPVILNGIENGKLKEYYVYMEIYMGNTGNAVDLVCEPSKTAGMFDRNFIIKSFVNFKYGYYTEIDGVTIEIFCKKQCDFIKADYSKRRVVEYFTDVSPFISDNSYEVRLKFEGEKLESYKVNDFMGLVEPEDSDLVSEKIYTLATVEHHPSFPGGYEAMLKWIRDNMNYPSDASAEGINSRVFISFCISETGEIMDVKVELSRQKVFEEEAIRLVKAMPTWEPGFHHGVPVKVRYFLPMDFYRTKP